jgi:ATP-dependent RNA helicase DHX29
VDVSDIESEIDLDELIPTYLKIKGKLYVMDPSLVETPSKKQSKGTKGKKGSSNRPPSSPTARKLLSQLQQIASDPLFDEYEAEAQWPARRNQIAQDRATRRQEQNDQPAAPENEKEPKVAVAVEAEVPKSDPLTTVEEPKEPDDEVDLLGGMFSAVPDVLEPRQAENETTVSENVTLRDFGKSSGLTPRRLLEEAVRSRYVILTLLIYTDLLNQGPECAPVVQDDITHYLHLPAFANHILVEGTGY